MTKIVFLTYGDLRKLIENTLINTEEDFDTEIIDVTFDNILPTALEVQYRNPESIFITAGSYASTLQSHPEFTSPLIEIVPSEWDVLNIINTVLGKPDQRVNAGEHLQQIGWVSYKNSDPFLNLVAKLTYVDIKECVFTEKSEVDGLIQEMLADGIRHIVGGSYAVSVACCNGAYSYLMRTENDVRAALDKAAQFAKQQEQIAEVNRQLKAMFDTTQEAVILVNERNTIESLSSQAERIIGIRAAKAVGGKLDQIIPEFGFLNHVKAEEITTNNLIRLRGIQLAVNRIPIIINGKLICAVITLQNVTAAQKPEKSSRRALDSKGFSAKAHFSDIVTADLEMQKQIMEAQIFSLSDSTILLLGESGTGKDIFAQSIHNSSPRANRPFVAVNCSAFPESLLESELFGYEEGAFSGAKRGGKAGLFELANGGTLFLDEVGEMPIMIQTRLLRVLENKEIMRLGGQSIVKVDVRIIAATNCDLLAMVQNGKFRGDLFYRLNVLEIHVPSLRQRRADIPLLAAAFLRENLPAMSENELQAFSNCPALTHYDWPGNIRELKNVMERFSILHAATGVGADYFHTLLSGFDQEEEQSEISHSERECLLEALSRNHWNKQLAAEELGISRTTIWRRMKKYNLI